MKIKKIKIRNYRLLKEFELDLEETLSLVIGKNNTGKTSLLSALDKFIGERSFKNEFSANDFNMDFKEELKVAVTDVTINEQNFPFLGISLKIFISYNETDDLFNISSFMMDLNPDNKIIVLGFEYRLTYFTFQQLRADYRAFENKERAKFLKKKRTAKALEQINGASLDTKKFGSDGYQEVTSTASEENTAKEVSISSNESDEDSGLADIWKFLKTEHSKYFGRFSKTIEYNIDDVENPYENDLNYLDISKDKSLLSNLINFKVISAKRDVSNKDPDKSLSTLSSKIYKKTEANETELKAIEDFKDALTETDTQLDGIYKSLFETVISKVKKFGGAQKGESIVEIISTLQHRELLEGNTTVMYKHDEKDSLPEHYNGLGYMNLISMIFEIEILIQDFKRERTERPADINLLFIEEPEAHTHPQMQYIFIQNIKALLKDGIIREDGEKRELQTIISTHSSHIVSESDFDDIKYFKRVGKIVVAKNLKDLMKEYEIDPKEYKFLKQYLTISRAELFFADKAILIEGDTETILLPTMMKKFDVDAERHNKLNLLEDANLPLLSQNISVVEVGAYAQIFEKFINFLGIKSLIITDLDAVDANGEACEVSSGCSYSNSAISFFFNQCTLDDLKSYVITDKAFKKGKDWIQDSEGPLCLVYQVSEAGYIARSFEDAFININRTWINNNLATFKGIKNANFFNDASFGPYQLANRCIKKKTYFALDILYNSDEKFTNWQLPLYIKEGLQWLKRN